MPASILLDYSTTPRTWPAYLRILTGSKPQYVPAGADVPRIECVLARLDVKDGHLAKYRRVCGGPEGNVLPLAYAHALASPLHMAIFAHEAFPVRVLGLIHLRNRIVQARPLERGERFSLRTWIEGHRDSDRGQEFDLETELSADGAVVWSETSTFFARRKVKMRRSDLPVDLLPPEGVEPRHTPIDVAADTGRRYAGVSGDINPIHLWDYTAKPFGFKAAVAHGMWSLSRSAAELPFTAMSGPVELDVTFKLPVFLPTRLELDHWSLDAGYGFALKDRKDTKGRQHLSGTLLSASASASA